MTTGRMSLLAPTWLVLVGGLDSRGLLGCLVLFIWRGLQYGREITNPPSRYNVCGPSKPQAVVRL